MPKKKNLSLSFANLTCRFGERFVLLDLFEEVVFPALSNSDFERKYADTAYFFKDVKFSVFSIAEAPDPQLVVYGRLIKDTVLKRSQYYSREGGLVESEASLASAPSAFFVLDIDNHKLMYLPETSGAPSVGQFALTLEAFAKHERDRFIRQLKDESKKGDDPKTLGELRIDYPLPEVEATPLSSDSDVEKFMKMFDKVTRVTYRIQSSNAEINHAKTFRDLVAWKDDNNAEATSISHRNKNGLRKDVVSADVKSAAASGNQKVVIVGKGEDGTELIGSNESLKLEVPFRIGTESDQERAVRMLISYFLQTNSGRLRPDEGRPNKAKLEKLKRGINERS